MRREKRGRAGPDNWNVDVRMHTGNITTNPISSALQRNGLADGFVGAATLEKSREFASQILQLVEVGNARGRPRSVRPAQHLLNKTPGVL